MIRYAFNRGLLALKNRYQYDVRYQQHILQADLAAFIKFVGFQSMASHQAHIPAAPLYAARIRAIIEEDCGPCTQLTVDMALAAGVPWEIIQATIKLQRHTLPADIALVLRFTEQVLAHNPDVAELREEIRVLWGDKGLISLAFAISSYRVYPVLKYALGYGASCSRIQLNGQSVVPERSNTVNSGTNHG